MVDGHHYLTANRENFITAMHYHVKNSHFFYVQGRIPPHKDPLAVDAKLIQRFQILPSDPPSRSKWKCRRHRKWLRCESDVRYVRWHKHFILMATPGEGAFFHHERSTFRNLKTHPIRFQGYRISYREGHVRISIDRPTERILKRYFGKIACWERGFVENQFTHFPLEPWKPVYVQEKKLRRMVNRLRRAKGLEEVRFEMMRWKRVARKVYLPSPLGGGKVYPSSSPL